MILTCARNIQSLALRRNALNVFAVSRGFCEKITKNDGEPNETENSTEDIKPDRKLGGFARAFEKYTQPQEEPNAANEKLPDLPFATLLRGSKLIDVRTK